VATFYFDIEDGSQTTLDREGVELPDLQAAQLEAAVLAGELLRDRPSQFWGVRSWAMTVQDEAGLTLFTIVIAATAAAERVNLLRG